MMGRGGRRRRVLFSRKALSRSLVSIFFPLALTLGAELLFKRFHLAVIEPAEIINKLVGFVAKRLVDSVRIGHDHHQLVMRTGRRRLVLRLRIGLPSGAAARRDAGLERLPLVERQLKLLVRSVSKATLLRNMLARNTFMGPLLV